LEEAKERIQSGRRALGRGVLERNLFDDLVRQESLARADLAYSMASIGKALNPADPYDVLGAQRSLEGALIQLKSDQEAAARLAVRSPKSGRVEYVDRDMGITGMRVTAGQIVGWVAATEQELEMFVPEQTQLDITEGAEGAFLPTIVDLKKFRVKVTSVSPFDREAPRSMTYWDNPTGYSRMGALRVRCRIFAEAGQYLPDGLGGWVRIRAGVRPIGYMLFAKFVAGLWRSVWLLW
jgi:hypothetical protein